MSNRAPSPESFQPHQAELRLNDAHTCKMFSAAVRAHCNIELTEINTVGKPAAFEAIRAGLQGVCPPPNYSQLPTGIRFIRDDGEGPQTVSLLAETSSSLTELLKNSLLDYELDIVLSVRKSPNYIQRALNRRPPVREIARIKGDRTKRHEDDQLRKQKYSD